MKQTQTYLDLVDEINNLKKENAALKEQAETWKEIAIEYYNCTGGEAMASWLHLEYGCVISVSHTEEMEMQKCIKK